MAQPANHDEQPFIPVEVIRFILDHRRERLAKLAQQKNAADSVVSQAAESAATTTPPKRTEQDGV